MGESVLIALITGILAVVGSYAGNVAISQKKSQEDAIREAHHEQRQCDRMERIEEKLDEHNHYAEKLGEIRDDITKMQKDIEYLRKEKSK